MGVAPHATIRIAQADAAQHLDTRLVGLAVARRPVGPNHIDQLLAHGKDGVEGSFSGGRDETDLVTEESAPDMVGLGKQLGTPVPDFAGHAGGRSNQVEERERQRRLAYPGFTDDAEHLPRKEGEGDVVDDRHRAVIGLEDRADHLQRQDRFAHRCRGSVKNSIARPSSEKLSTVTTMARPGKVATHHWPVIISGAPIEIIEPHSGVGTRTPAPTKLSPAVSRMAIPTLTETCVNAGGMAIGKM